MTEEERQKVMEGLTYQSYAPQPQIEGAFYHPLKKFRTLEGAFMEVYRLSQGVVSGLPVPFEPQQVSLSWAEPGRINAFHIHPKRRQDELWGALQGTLLVWLIDLRPESKTCGVRRSFVLNGEEIGLLHIPSGVAHGYKAGKSGATLLYAMNSQFDVTNPNEGRIPWDAFGEELWEEDRG